jgi:hypothetical protein
LEQDNKTLKEEIKDLKANLKINKEIIEGFFNFNSKDERNKLYISKMKEEICELRIQLEKVIAEKTEIRNKVSICNIYYYLF